MDRYSIGFIPSTYLHGGFPPCKKTSKELIVFFKESGFDDCTWDINFLPSENLQYPNITLNFLLVINYLIYVNGIQIFTYDMFTNINNITLKFPCKIGHYEYSWGKGFFSHINDIISKFKGHLKGLQSQRKSSYLRKILFS